MDKGGSFCLKNLGKCSISVNNKEVGPGQSLSLISSCLIEVCSYSFLNMNIIKWYYKYYKFYCGFLGKPSPTLQCLPYLNLEVYKGMEWNGMSKS